MTIDTKRLRELAEKATPGPWAHYGTEPFEVYDSKEYSNGEPGPYVAKWVRDYDDAAYIAATDPQTVIALLDEIDRLRDQVDSMQMANDMLRHNSKKDNEYLLGEIERLRQWKAEAMDVLSEWEKTWIAAGRPGRIGTSKAASVREEIERLRGEGEWEYQGIPIYEDGSEAVGRSIEACREWIESDADPSHWIHEPHNSDLPAVVSYRVERRRKAGPWEPVEGDHR